MRETAQSRVVQLVHDAGTVGITGPMIRERLEMPVGTFGHASTALLSAGFIRREIDSSSSNGAIVTHRYFRTDKPYIPQFTSVGAKPGAKKGSQKPAAVAPADTVLITLDLGDATLRLTLTEAKRVYKRLGEIFG